MVSVAVCSLRQIDVDTGHDSSRYEAWIALYHGTKLVQEGGRRKIQIRREVSCLWPRASALRLYEPNAAAMLEKLTCWLSTMAEGGQQRRIEVVLSYEVGRQREPLRHSYVMS